MDTVFICTVSVRERARGKVPLPIGLSTAGCILVSVGWILTLFVLLVFEFMILLFVFDAVFKQIRLMQLEEDIF